MDQSVLNGSRSCGARIADPGAGPFVVLARPRLSAQHDGHSTPIADESTEAGRVNDGPDALRDVERQRLAALVEGDLATAATLHADDYELITPGGRAISKKEYLGDIGSGAIRFVVFEPAGEVRVRLEGDAGIVRYKALIDIRFPGDERDHGVMWHTDYYERRDGQWRAVWSHATRTAGG
jgi:hypothetical protein